jgi:DNA-3-methyladenine glycosylase
MSNTTEFCNRPAPEVARALLGCEIERVINGEHVRVKIVETEAYDQSDPASHSFKGRTARTAVMFGPAGRLYVYFTYGMHYCCNIVTGPEGEGAAVLIRAVEPIGDHAALSRNRQGRRGVNLTNGPAKLCQALQIDKTLNGHSLDVPPVTLLIKADLLTDEIIQSTRIGISQAQETAWRFYIADNPFISSQRRISDGAVHKLVAKHRLQA